MSQLGAASPLKHVRGFFYPVKEKPEIQAALDEPEASEAAELEAGTTTAQGTHRLTRPRPRAGSAARRPGPRLAAPRGYVAAHDLVAASASRGWAHRSWYRHRSARESGRSMPEAADQSRQRREAVAVRVLRVLVDADNVARATARAGAALLAEVTRRGAPVRERTAAGTRRIELAA